MDTVLGKVVAVLRSFTADDHGVSLAELGRRTGLAKGTLHRVLNDLVQVGLLDRSVSGYRLSGQMFEPGMRASVERGLLEVATPFMEDLYERTISRSQIRTGPDHPSETDVRVAPLMPPIVTVDAWSRQCSGPRGML